MDWSATCPCEGVIVKRAGNLWREVTSLENLFLASYKAQKGKRYRENVLLFNSNLEDELIRMQQDLTEQTYHPGKYYTFQIVEPKKRMISAAPYSDRVVHHALCNIIVPVFEKSFIEHTYANRKGYGTHAALNRFTKLARRYKYVFQGDIRQYFPSIDHEILKRMMRRRVKCHPTLWLIDTIIDASNDQRGNLFYFVGDTLYTPLERRRGLPIGNLTSQFFANIYLSGFDHFVQEELGVSGYVRYVDDFALFSDDRSRLVEARKHVEEYLAGLRLKIHPIKSQIFETRRGPAFVGFNVLPDRIRVRADNLRRSRRRLRGYQRAYRTGEMSSEKVRDCIRSWIGHLKHGNTWRLRQRIFTDLVFQRSGEAR